MKAKLLFGAALLIAAVAYGQLQSPQVKVVPIAKWADEKKTSAPGMPVHLIHEGEHETINVVTPDKEIPLHYHEKHEETVYIVRGKGRMSIDGVERDVNAGDLIILPKRTRHSFTPKSNDCVAISIFAPKFDGRDRIFVGR